MSTIRFPLKLFKSTIQLNSCTNIHNWQLWLSEGFYVFSYHASSSKTAAVVKVAWRCTRRWFWSADCWNLLLMPLSYVMKQVQHSQDFFMLAVHTHIKECCCHYSLFNAFRSTLSDLWRRCGNHFSLWPNQSEIKSEYSFRQIASKQTDQ